MNDKQSKLERRARNIEILAGVGSESENQKHIFARLRARFERNKLVAMVLKHIRQDKQRALTNAELYLDDWGFHHNGITKENLPQAMSDCLDRVLTLHNAKQQQREDAEFRELTGGLGDGFDGVFGDLPSDEDIEAELTKQDPSLKQYRK